jgi:TrmH family RNA methyltransferase
MYSPKVINATMGSFARVKIVYTDLESFLDRNSQKFEVFGADMDGKSIHKMEIKRPSILVMGNESHGLSQGIMAHINQTVSIPRLGKAESLNVALSTAILCDNIVRQFNG